VAHLDAPVGSIDLALHSYFSMLGPDPVMRFVAGAQAAALAPLIEASEARGLPLLSVAAPGRFGGRSGPANFTEIEAGPLTRRHLSDILPFPNQLTALIVTGRTITEWLGASARAFRLIGPGSRGQALINPDFPGHDFDVLFGLTYRFDLTRQKAIDIRWNGRRLDPEEQFAVAVNSFRARGGGHHGVLDAAREIRLPPISLHRVLAAWIAGTLPPDPLADQPYPWSFERIGGTTVTARTGKGATRYLADLPNLNAVSSGAKADGFVQVELKL